MSNLLVQGLYDAILNGAQAPMAGGEIFVVLESPTRPIDANKLAGLAAHDGAGEASLELELFSRLVDDDLPALVPVWQGTGIGLTDVYSTILMSTPVGSVQAVKFGEAQRLCETMKLGSLVQPGVEFLPTWPNPVSWAAAESDQLWTELSIESDGDAVVVPNPFHQSPLQSWPNVAANLSLDDGPTGGIAHFKDPFPRVARNDSALSALDLDALDLTSHGGMADFRGLSFASAKLHNIGPGFAQWDPDDPRSGPLGPDDLPLPKKLILSPKLPLDPIHIVIDHNEIPSTYQPSTSTLPPKSSLKLKYLRVSLTRRWLSWMILKFPSWSLQGFKAGYYSTGSRERNDGKTPLIPTSFIAIKDLEIKGSWSDKDSQDIYARLHAPGSTSFGPFTISNGGALGTFDGSTLRIPGISILAWYCNILPLVPPKNG